MSSLPCSSSFFFFNDTATTEIYTLSLHDALPIYNPVCFLEHLMLEFTSGEVPEEEYTIPFGVADVKRKGKDVTVVATGLMVLRSLEVAGKLEGEGISV